MPNFLLTLVIILLILLFILLTFFQKNNTLISPTKFKGRFWSLITGYTSFIIHAGGQPISFFLLPQKLNKTLYVGTLTLVFFIINLIKLIPYMDAACGSALPIF